MASAVDALAALRRDLAAAELADAAAAETWRGAKGEKARSAAYEVLRRLHNRRVALGRKLDALEAAAAKRQAAAAAKRSGRGVPGGKLTQLRLFNPRKRARAGRR